MSAGIGVNHSQVMGRRTVTADYWSAMHEHFGEVIMRDARFRRTLFYFMFGSRRDVASDQLILDYYIIAHFQGKNPKTARTENFLQNVFKPALPNDCNLSWQEEDHFGHRCRLAHTIDFGSFQKIYENELTSRFDEKINVSIEDGSPVSRKKLKKERDALIEASKLRPCQVEDTRMIADYLHSLPLQPFSRMQKRLPEAYEAAEKLEKGDDAATAKLRKRVLRELRNFAEQPFQIYTSGERTTRLFAPISVMKREITKILTRDFENMDLQSVQLAAVAHLLELTELEEFLRGPISIWDEINDNLGTPEADRADVKQALIKQIVYAACFGMAEISKRKNSDSDLHREAAAIIETYGFPPKMFADLFNNKWIRMIIDARKPYYKKIRAVGHGVDCYGREILLIKRRVEPHQVLCQQAQAIETKLIAAPFHLANEEIARAKNKNQDARWYIVLLIHDAIGLFVRDKSRTDSVKKQIRVSVELAAKVLGVQCYLNG